MSENGKARDVGDLLAEAVAIKAELAEAARTISRGARRASVSFARLSRLADDFEAFFEDPRAGGGSDNG